MTWAYVNLSSGFAVQKRTEVMLGVKLLGDKNVVLDRIGGVQF